MQHAVTRWVQTITGQRGVWTSQAAAIEALVLHDASPAEAKTAARAAFARS